MKIIITESQLKYLIVEAQQIIVIDFCGRSKQEDYQKWWYDGGQTKAPYTNSYTWNATKNAFVFDFNKDPEFKNLTQSQRDYKLRIKCSGSYKEQPNLISAGVKEIQKFAKWLPQTLQDWVDWITWFLQTFGGPQGIAIAKLAQAIQGVGYIYFAFGQKTLLDQVNYFIEGFSQLLSTINIKLKYQGLVIGLIELLNTLVVVVVFKVLRQN